MSLLVVMPFGTLTAQNAGGLTASVTLDQRLEYENRIGATQVRDEGFSTVTDLGLVVQTATPTQQFRVNFNGGLRYEINDNGRGNRSDFDDPRLRLSYATQNRTTRLRFDGSYQRIDIDLASDDLNIDDDAITGGGTRTNTRLGSTLELGRAAPIGATLRYTVQTTRYSGTTDPTLVDLDIKTYSATLRFDVNAQLRLTSFATVTDRDAAGTGSDRKPEQYGVTATYQINPRTGARARLLFSRTDNDDADASITSRLSLSYSQALSDISRLQASLSLAERNVRRTTSQDQHSARFSMNHQYELGRDMVLVSGFSYSKTKRDGLDDTGLSRFFVGLKKTFNWRP